MRRIVLHDQGCHGSRDKAGEFGLAIVYSSVLVIVMLVAILVIQVLVGERRLGRRAPALELGAAGG